MRQKLIKTYIWAILIIFMVVFTIVVWFLQPWLLRNYNNAKTAELVFYTSIQNKHMSKETVLLSSEDMTELISYLENGGICSGGICTPVNIAIRLSNDWQSVLLFPAGDGCSGLGFTTNYKDESVIISKDNMGKLIDFIQARMPSKEQIPSFEDYDYYKHEWTVQ